MIPESYLIDTSIWMDLYEDRRGYHDEPLGEYAMRLLVALHAAEKEIIISDHLLGELAAHYTPAQVKGLFLPFVRLLRRIDATPRQREEAKNIAVERSIPAGDALHAILARDHRCMLITRDRHFRLLEDITKPHKPEEIEL
jgi:predicted nucleic acid-binding protein